MANRVACAKCHLQLCSTDCAKIQSSRGADPTLRPCSSDAAVGSAPGVLVAGEGGADASFCLSSPPSIPLHPLVLAERVRFVWAFPEFLIRAPCPNGLPLCAVKSVCSIDGGMENHFVVSLHISTPVPPLLLLFFCVVFWGSQAGCAGSWPEGQRPVNCSDVIGTCRLGEAVAASSVCNNVSTRL